VDLIGTVQTVSQIPIVSVLFSPWFPPLAISAGFCVGGWAYLDLTRRKEQAGFALNVERRRNNKRNALIGVGLALCLFVALPLGVKVLSHKSKAVLQGNLQTAANQIQTPVTPPLSSSNPIPSTSTETHKAVGQVEVKAPHHDPQDHVAREIYHKSKNPPPEALVSPSNDKPKEETKQTTQTGDVSVPNSENASTSKCKIGIVFTGGFGNLVKDASVVGCSTGVEFDNSPDSVASNVTVSDAPVGLVDELKQRVFDDAGDPQKLRADFEWLRGELRPMWGTDPDTVKAAESQFQAIEDLYLSKASDRDAVRRLLPGLSGGPTEKSSP
jgi:hypothetical protein